MKFSGVILQMIGITAAVVGIAVGVLNSVASRSGGGAGLTVTISSIIGGVFIYGVGASFRALAIIVENSHRSADALESLARRTRVKTQPGVYPAPKQEIPAPPIHR